MQVHENLERLGLDVLDVVNLRTPAHDGASEESIATAFTALAELQQEGLIKHLGLSGVTIPAALPSSPPCRAAVWWVNPSVGGLANQNPIGQPTARWVNQPKLGQTAMRRGAGWRRVSRPGEYCGSGRTHPGYGRRCGAGERNRPSRS